MSQNTDLLRVAHPKERNSATNGGICATPTATTNATDTLKALARKAQERNSQRNRPQRESATSATNTPPENTHLLRSVAMVPDGHPDPLRWPRFIALCIADGVTESEVQTMFREQDIEHLCHSRDDALPKMAATIVGAIKRDPNRQKSTPAKAPTYTERHRCGRCQHYSLNPTTGATGLGWCNVRDDVGMVLPSKLIECDHYQKRTPIS
ncbi:MAG: hypothetical protein AB8B63_06505 [Granulosicoccus sp.]